MIEIYWSYKVRMHTEMPAHAISFDKVHLKGTVYYFTNNPSFKWYQGMKRCVS